MNDVIGYANGQNNAGVHCYTTAGNPAAALLHFRQSLRAKLVVENRLQQNESTGTSFGLFDATVDSNKAIEVDPQQQHLSSSSMALQQDDASNEVTPLNIGTGTISFLRITLSLCSHDSHCFHFSIIAKPTKTGSSPYIYTHLFLIQDQHVTSCVPVEESTPDSMVLSSTTTVDSTMASLSSVTTSAMILFNLALTHHSQDRTSVKASSIYEIALTLLNALPPATTSESLLLHVAVLNNYGVWCYENQDFDVAFTCFGEVIHLFNEAGTTFEDDEFSNFDVAAKRGFYNNLRAFVME
jgi:hypothetical protein